MNGRGMFSTMCGMKQGISEFFRWIRRGGRRELACESCGTEFACTPGVGGCWCREVQLTDAARQAMRAKYGDCLCRACLVVAAGAAKTSAVRP